MTRRRLLLVALVASLISVALAGQTDRAPVGVDLPAGPLAISGAGSSARHCVSGDAANVHGIGWVPAGTSYTITFDSALALTTSVSRLDLAGSRSAAAFGTPDLRFTGATPGSMALFVGGRGQAGCYRYKVEIQPGAASLVPVSTALPPLALITPAKFAAGTMAISGDPSSARHCVTGNAAKIHGIGRVEQGASVRVAFESDFDPVAGVSLVSFAPEQASHYMDNDSGGDLEPSLFFTAAHAGTLALHVGSANGRDGCYRYQVQIQGGAAPAPSPTPTPAPAPGPAPAPVPNPGTYAVAVANASCRYVRTDASGDPTRYHFAIVASGTATAPDVGGRLHLGLWFGLQTDALSCGGWTPEYTNDIFSESVVCRRPSGQPATTTWNGSFSNYYVTRRGTHSVPIRAAMWDLRTDRATHNATVTCITP
jgi:hypothetical protein